jgi:hypothetical protein
MQRHIWTEIGRMDQSLVDIVLDECIAAATAAGIGSRSCTLIADTLVSLASLHTRGKIVALLRKSFSRAAGNSKLLGEEQAWHHLSALTRVVLVICHHGR